MPSLAVINVIMIILRLLELLLKNRIFTIRTGLAKGLRRRYGFGFKPRFSLTEEERFLMRLDFKGKTVFDVGGYIGIFAMFFARSVGKTGNVITFEPNPRNHEELVYNVKLNKFDNVNIIQVGLGRRHEQIELAIDPISPARGTVEMDRKKKVLGKKGAKTIKIDLAPLDSLMEKKKLPRPDFVKLDVEGFEMEVLYGMVETIHKYKPNLFIELPNLEISRNMIEFLISKKYTIYDITSNMKINSCRSALIKEGHHVFCE